MHVPDESGGGLQIARRRQETGRAVRRTILALDLVPLLLSERELIQRGSLVHHPEHHDLEGRCSEKSRRTFE